MKINIRVIPRSSKNEVIKTADGFKVKLTAAPVDNKANAALIKLLSEHFKTPKSKIEIVKGERGKNKIVSLRGVPTLRRGDEAIPMD